MIKLILRKGREESLRRFHPWVFSGAVAEIQGRPAEGDIVAVHASDGTLLAYGHYQIGSIAVRVLSFDDAALRPDFFEQRIAAALAMRRTVGLAGVSGEAEAGNDLPDAVNGLLRGSRFICFRRLHEPVR